MRELLIRYLLGELDPEEHQQLHAELQRNAELRSELARLRACIAANQQEELPGGLAERTAECVAGCSIGANESADFLSRRAAALAAAAEPPAGVLGWSLADLTVAGGVVLAVSMLLFPALGDSRDGTRRHVCANNQRELYVLVTNFRENNDGVIPRVGPNDFAGVFASQLVDHHYVRPQDLAMWLVCPGAPLADEIRSGQFKIRIPSVAALRAMSPAAAAMAAKAISPFLAYRFPHQVNGEYRYLVNDRQSHSPLFSDTSGDEADGMMSPNHGGYLVQVTFADGSVRSFTTCEVPGLEDNFFRNALGRVAAGCDRRDSVLGPSDAKPAIEVVGQRQ